MRKKKNRDSGKKTRRRKGKRRPASSEGPVIKRGGREGLQVSIFAEWEVGDVTVFTKSKDQLAGRDNEEVWTRLPSPGTYRGASLAKDGESATRPEG